MSESGAIHNPEVLHLKKLIQIDIEHLQRRIKALEASQKVWAFHWELLEALRDLLAQIDASHAGFAHTINTGKAVAAIAKAEGK